MVEPLFVSEFASPPKEGDVVELGGAEGKHAAGVRRMRVGEGIQLTNGIGLRVRGEVVEVHSRALSVRVKNVQNAPIPALAITLVQALAKGDRDELAVQAATEIGISAVIPWESDRSVSRWVGDKKVKGVDRWQQIVTEAAKQSLQVHFPVVKTSLDSKSLSKIIGDFDLVLVLDPNSTRGFDSIPIPSQGKVAIVVGPEGGITEAELVEFISAGAVGLKLGEAILRTSTAGVAALAAIKALSGQWA